MEVFEEITLVSKDLQQTSCRKEKEKESECILRLYATCFVLNKKQRPNQPFGSQKGLRT